MPTYQYKCTACSYELESLQKMSDEPLKDCPKCHKNTLQKLISGGLGLHFKGSGFYITDYNSPSCPKPGIKENQQSEKLKAPQDHPKDSKNLSESSQKSE